jgi:hypothetical protein
VCFRSVFLRLGRTRVVLMETTETAETDGNNGNRRFLLERIRTDRNGYERICSVATTTFVAEPRDSIFLLTCVQATALVA